MESATLHGAPRSGQIQAALVALLLAFAIGGWVLSDERMAGMDMGPGSELGGLGWFLGVWVVMMAAMMLPSIAPIVIAFAGTRPGGRGQAEAGGLTLAFVAGYLSAWTAAGLAGYTLIELVRSLDLGFLDWEAAGPYVAGGMIAAAALYQLSPLKDACLRRCREPQRFLAEHRHPGPVGALRTGLVHGGYCIGCCWALMAVLFALGVMSLTWMAFVAALIGAEKLLPAPAAPRHGIAVLLAALGLAVALTPEDVPGLTVPASAEAMESMGPMGAAEPMGGKGPRTGAEPMGTLGVDNEKED
jgi:predicted metal-binding membrane protein